MFRKLHLYLFVILCVVFLTGLNDFIAVKLEVEKVLSVLILILISILFFCRLLIDLDSFLVSIFPGDTKIYTLVVLSFLFFGSLMATLNGKPSDVIWGIRYYVPGLLVFLISFHSLNFIIKDKSLLFVINIIRNIINLNAVLIIGDFITSGALGFSVVDGRYSGLTLNPNEAGFLLNISLILGLLILTSNQSAWNWLMIIVPFLAIVVTFSKTAIISSGIILLISSPYFLGSYLGELRKHYRARYVQFFVLLLVFVFSGLNFDKILPREFEAYQIVRFEQIKMLLLGDLEDSEVSSKRLELAELAIGKLSDNWVFGNGIKSLFIMDESGMGSHNQFLLILGESGIIPFIIFILYFYKLLTFKNSGKYINFSVKMFALSYGLYCLTCHNILFSKSVILIVAFFVNLTIILPKKKRLVT